MAAKKTAKKTNAEKIRELRDNSLPKPDGKDAGAKKLMTSAIIENMHRLHEDDLEEAVRAMLGGADNERLKEIHYEVVEVPEMQVSAILAGLKLLTNASAEERAALGVDWGPREIRELSADIEGGDLELVETEDE